MFQKILVPVDGSDTAGRAVEVASDLAVKYGAELVVLHVMQEIGTSHVPQELEGYAKIEHIAVTERDVLVSVAAEIVGRGITRARELGADKVGDEIRTGKPGEEIVDFARNAGVDLIVMGRRGLGRVADLLMGSVSHRVTQLADCACLTVK